MNLKHYIVILNLIIFVISCNKNPQSPGHEYMPDMYRPNSVEAYMDYNNPDSLSARKPAKGTIPFDEKYIGKDKTNFNLPWPYKNTSKGYKKAGKIKENPIKLTPEVLKEGERLYADFCVHCHGEKGKGQGSIVERGKFPPPPDYKTRYKTTSVGQAFHSITYGKGLMGGHASQLSKEERWKLVHYTKVLANGGKSPFDNEKNKKGETNKETDSTANKSATMTDTTKKKSEKS
ncbi:MAG: cytochrome c [Flavobacteriales bacterium]